MATRAGGRIESGAPGAFGAGRRGATPLWLSCVLVAAGLSWAVGRLQASSEAAGFTRLDPRRVAIELPAGTAGLPAEWNRIVALRLSRLGELSTLDEELAASVVAELETLPFVREVGEARVVWPDGLDVDIRLREPVACVCLGEDYLPVASDGVVLPGYRDRPPDLGRGRLPVIGPLDAATLDLRPGDRLQEERHLDALSVAVSMRRHLSRPELGLLGPVVIDAEEAWRAAVDEPGTRLRLEEGRTVYFGRPPRHGAPGELPAKRKWANLMSAVAGLEEGGPGWTDWDLLDLRWDTPTLRPRVGYR